MSKTHIEIKTKNPVKDKNGKTLGWVDDITLEQLKNMDTKEVKIYVMVGTKITGYKLVEGIDLGDIELDSDSLYQSKIVRFRSHNEVISDGKWGYDLRLMAKQVDDANKIIIKELNTRISLIETNLKTHDINIIHLFRIFGQIEGWASSRIFNPFKRFPKGGIVEESNINKN